MKATVQTLPQALVSEKSWVAVFMDLFKARLTLLVLLTTMVGFYLGSAAGQGPWGALHVVFGMALVAAGGASLNQLLECEHDSKMRRTQDRPLPSKRLEPFTVLWVGCVSSATGILYLALAVNLLTSLLSALTLLIYVGVYTPLKRVTWLNTLVGAIPGAMPPLIGWTAARGQIDLAGLALFAIQVLWQVPHFLAIAWMYRDEYARAGFKMLPVFDPAGVRTSRQALLYAAGLLAASVALYPLRLAGPFYLGTSLVLGIAFVWFALQFKRELTISRARQLFFASILYLPLLLIAMVLDKWS